MVLLWTRVLVVLLQSDIGELDGGTYTREPYLLRTPREAVNGNRGRHVHLVVLIRFHTAMYWHQT